MKEKIEKILEKVEKNANWLDKKVIIWIWELADILEEVLLEKEKIKLEPKNFKINSDGWVKKTDENGVEYLENPEWDIWELLSNWEQLFTWEAGMREVDKAGKRLPTDEEFKKVAREDWSDVIYTGYRKTDGFFYDLGYRAGFWSSTENGSNIFYRYLDSSHSAVIRFACNKTNGFSIRCVQD